MSTSSGWRRLLRLPRSDIRAGVEDEIDAHLTLLTADLVAQGLSPADARLQAEREFGAVGMIRDECIVIERRRRRRVNLSEALMSMLQDIRHTARSLRGSMGFTTAAVLCTALGVGATTTIFSAVHATLIRPLPFEKADDLVAVYAAITAKNERGVNISYADFVNWRDENKSFTGLGIWTWTSPSFTGTGVGGAERVDGAAVSANLFPILGVRPIMGRTFTESEAVAGNDHVVILGYGLWQRRFSGDANIVGRTVNIDLEPYTVVGVMPRGFAFPETGQAWTPFVPERNPVHGNRGYAGAIGRLRPGVSQQLAQRDLDVIMQRLAREFPENVGWAADVVGMREDLVGKLERPLEVFSAAVVLVLLIACANVANLTLTRGAARRREIAVRTALGAARGRIVRQLVTESLMLSVLGGIIGAGIAFYGVKLLRLGFPDDVPYYIPIGVNVPTLLFAAFVSVIAGLAFGIAPAFRATGGSLDRALREGGRAGSDGPSRARIRNAIVVGELALSVTLMIGAGLLVKSYRSLSSTKLGFEEKGILSFRVSLPSAKYENTSSRLAFYEKLQERLGALPGVESVALAQGIPFSGWNVQASMVAKGWPKARAGEDFVAHYQYVSPTFFKTIGVPLVRGRGLTDADRDTVNVVGLINATFAKRAFPNEDPIGKQVHVGDDASPWVTIVGVIQDYRHYRLPEPMGPALYFPLTAYAPVTETVVIRVKSGDPTGVMPAARQAIRELDPDMPPYRIATFEQAVGQSLWRQRFQGLVVGVFAVLALLLAAVGIYGVISYSVAQRTREFGVRVALGAQVRDIVGLVLRHGAVLAAWGVVLGVLGGAVLTRFLEGLLYDTQPRDPVVFSVVALGLGAVALLAVSVPAWRATAVDPLVAMRPD